MNSKPGLLANRIGDRLAELNWELKEFASRHDITYEHGRRILRGLSLPSRSLLRLISLTLDLSFEEMERLARMDDMRNRYGDVLTDFMRRDPSLSPIESAWASLTDEHRQEAVRMVQEWAESDRRVSVTRMVSETA